jgi:pSer/pThr/pTyr-binding forkhead associated (FHA) protein
MTKPIDGADAWLVDDRWSKAYSLGPETNIGRGSESSIILRDPVISRRHACVVREADAYVLLSYGAAGTRVNGLGVAERHVLHEGDIVEIAFTTLRFSMMAPTGEMFVVARDTPTLIDRQMEGPTRATMAAPAVRRNSLLHPGVMIAIAIAIVVLLWIILRTATAPRV